MGLIKFQASASYIPFRRILTRYEHEAVLIRVSDHTSFAKFLKQILFFLLLVLSHIAL